MYIFLFEAFMASLPLLEWEVWSDFREAIKAVTDRPLPHPKVTVTACTGTGAWLASTCGTSKHHGPGFMWIS